jgi:hypothetical protein
MTSLSELRDQALACREKAESEPLLEAKRALYRKALELAQIAEKMGRNKAALWGSPMRRSGSK